MRITGRSSRRLACAVPVFKAGKGSVEAHLVAAGRSIVAANAYGYENPATTELGGTTVGGLARVVVGKRGCRTAWTSKEISPSAQAVVSRATGLLYTLTKPAGFRDAWNLTAIDWRTGATRFAARQRARRPLRDHDPVTPIQHAGAGKGELPLHDLLGAVGVEDEEPEPVDDPIEVATRGEQ